MKGLTGVIKFDYQGFRSDFTLDIIELTRDGLQKAGTWNSSEGVNYTRSYGENQKQIVEILQNKTLIVTTILVRDSALINLDAYWYIYRVHRFSGLLHFVNENIFPDLKPLRFGCIGLMYWAILQVLWHL